MSFLQVNSEIGILKKVLLHRPGRELENLTPDRMENLLFDDIPFLKRAQVEHDFFAEVLRNNGVEIFYLEDLAAESLWDETIRQNFIQRFLQECGIHGASLQQVILQYLSSCSNQELIERLMSGIRFQDLAPYQPHGLQELVYSHHPFILDPLPNLYFTRDPFAIIGNGVSINAMKTQTRRRETLFANYIFQYHPLFAQEDIPHWYQRTDIAALEGGDQLVLNQETVAIGISERTEAFAIETFAKRILNSGQSFRTVLAFEIPKKRAFMHLDTVFTMIDTNKFTIHPEIQGPLQVYAISKDSDHQQNQPGNYHDTENGLSIYQEKLPLQEVLKKYLHLSEVILIPCGGGDLVDAAREQWNDGSNTLAIAPGEVIVYERNHVTNQLLLEHGIKIHPIPSSELSRGRGGPRCMSMPLYRENLP